MPAIKLTGFIGEQPQIVPRLLPDTAAQEAYDARLDDGGLTPMRVSAKIADAGIADPKTFLRFDGAWLAFSSVVHAAPGPVAQSRLYYTGDGVPKMRVNDLVYPLAVPAPTAALTGTISGTGTGDAATRVYVYTWVTDYGEESEPSPASADVTWKASQTVTLSGFEAAPTGRNITKQRVYRSQTGQVGTYLYFIAERDVTTDDFIDNVAVNSFQEPLPSADWNAPPDGLSGLVSLPNGMMAAFVGRDLYFCEPWRPHAWPEKYVLTLDYEIVGLGAIGTALIVMTTGQPYYVSGNHPGAMASVKIEQNLPCINARGIVDLGFAICYPSYDGLVRVDASGGAAVVTANLFNRDKWLKLSPGTAVAAQVTGRYVLFYDTIDADANVFAGALFIDVGGTPYLIRSTDRVTAAWYDLSSTALYAVRRGTGDIYEIDPSTGALKTYYWRSKQFMLPAPHNFGAILIDSDAALTEEEVAKLQAQYDAALAANRVLIEAGPIDGEMNSHPINSHTLNGDILAPLPNTDAGIEVSVIADGVIRATRTVANKALRLPSGFTARKWEIAAKGRVTITQITMASTIADLQNS
jgi:hypothetical protein